MGKRPYEGTTVHPDKSRSEIRTALKRYGVEEFGYFERPAGGSLFFVHRDRHIRIDVLVTPQPSQPKFQQEERRLWRVARHWILNQLEAVESGLIELGEAFFAHTVMQDGSTAYQWAQQHQKELPLRQPALPLHAIRISEER
jgi:hypothetical protein